MSLAAGTSFGPYEVIELLGAGGMGEVYRAHDPRLGRDIALKVLPERFKLDTHRLTRFTREARVLASLNHPNIAALYGVEEHANAQALIIELVDGHTLADRIASGPLPLAESLAIARQIAAGLEAAHEHGIVHRDLKPANIKLRSDGAVKLLDFGLAKVLDPGAEGTDPGAATGTATEIIVGSLMGTPAYMSPEQARGLRVDQRGDVWAFGCVLFELLTGRPAFGRETTSDTVAAILAQEPEWSDLPDTTPALLERLLRRCLTKDPKDRLRHIGDAHGDLKDLSALLSSVPVRNTTRDPRLLGRRSIRLRMMTIAAGAASVGLLVWWSWSMPSPSAPRVTRFEIVPPADQPLVVRNYTSNIAISRDGTRLAYSSTQGTLVIRSIDQLDGTRLRGLGSDATTPFFSSDGSWVGFYDGDLLKKVPVQGGPATTLADIGGYTDRDSAWGSTDAILTASTGGLLRVAADGSEPEVLAVPDRQHGEKAFSTPELLPDGRSVLLTIRPSTATQSNHVAAFDLKTGVRKELLLAGSQPKYLRTGHLLFAAGSTLQAVAFDLYQMEIRGEPVTVATDVLVVDNGMANFGVSDDGTLVYLRQPFPTSGRQLVWVNRDGDEQILPAPQLNYAYARISPDGARLALDVREPEGDVWTWDLEREILTRITFDPAENPVPVWSPDGRHLAFGDGRSGAVNLYRQPADGSGEMERLTTSPRRQIPIDFTPDGSQLVFTESNSETSWDIAVLWLEGTRRSEPLLSSRFSEMNPDVSPDGRWMAYSSDESGQAEIYVRPFPDVHRARWQVSSGGGTRPQWSRDGRELFYLDAQRALLAVHVLTTTNFSSGPATRLFDASLYVSAGVSARPYDVSADGQRFLMQRAAQPNRDNIRPPQIIVALNWFEELKRLVPVQ